MQLFFEDYTLKKKLVDNIIRTTAEIRLINNWKTSGYWTRISYKHIYKY